MTPKDIIDFKRIMLDIRPWIVSLVIAAWVIAVLFAILVYEIYALLSSRVIISVP